MTENSVTAWISVKFLNVISEFIFLTWYKKLELEIETEVKITIINLYAVRSFPVPPRG